MTFNTARNILAIKFYGTKEWKEINRILNQVDENPWHTGTPTEEGDYLVAFRMSDNSVEYGWCNWNNGAWDILCDYDPDTYTIVAWQRITPFEGELNGHTD